MIQKRYKKDTKVDTAVDTVDKNALPFFREGFLMGKNMLN